MPGETPTTARLEALDLRRPPRTTTTLATAALALLASALAQGCSDASKPLDVSSPDAAASGGGISAQVKQSSDGATIKQTVRISGVVDPHIPEFAAAIGNPNNGNEPGPRPATGRREINWDGVQAPFLNNDNFPGDFFNVRVPRGTIYEALQPGEEDDEHSKGEQHEEDEKHEPRGADATPQNGATPGPTNLRVDNQHFADVNPTYRNDLIPFSEPSMFAPVGTNRLEVKFRIPGTGTPAVVQSFGAVVVDVDKAEISRVKFFDRHGDLIADVDVPVRKDPDEYSLVGVTFSEPVIAKVVFILGDSPIGAQVNDVSSGGTKDVVVLDDFLYSEPQPIVPIERIVQISGVVDPHIPEFAAAIGNPNNGNEPGPRPATGRREINWDGVQAPFLNNDNFPEDFFNKRVPRGTIYDAEVSGKEEVNGEPPGPGTHLRVDNQHFADVNPTYANDLIPFSEPSMFTTVGARKLQVKFRVPGTDTKAAVQSFGAVVVDVDKPELSRLQAFDRHGTLIADIPVPVRQDPDEYSLVGVTFREPVIAKVVLLLGDGRIGATVNDVSSGGTQDVVVLDDFLYSEPQPLQDEAGDRVADANHGHGKQENGSHDDGREAIGAVAVGAGVGGATNTTAGTP